MRENKSPEVTVIILNLDGIEFTRKCIRSVLSSNYPNLKVLVVDNGSEGDEAGQVRKEFRTSQLSIIKNKINVGFAKGNNIGARQVRSKYVVFLNNDTFVDKNWLAPLVFTAEKNRRVVVCQPKLLSAANKEYFDYAGAAGGFVDKFGYPFARGRILFSVEKDIGQYDEGMEIVWASGAAMLVDRKKFLEFGGFDEDFFIYHEETDFCWRLKENGYKIFYVPESVVYHYGGAFTAKDPPRRIFLLHRNMWLMTLKHLSLNRLVFRALFDLASIVFYLFRTQVRQAISVSTSYIWLIKNWKIVKKKRKYYKPDLKRDFLYPRSIVIDHYLFGKKRFSDLNL